MTTQEARAVFETAIAQTADPDKIARLELVREFFTDPEFRARLSDYLWERRA